MPNDNVKVKDSVSMTLNAKSAPSHPCHVCGKETKEHSSKEIAAGVFLRRRICSDRNCRSVIEEARPN